MTLVALILIPIVAGLIAWPVARWRAPAARWVCVAGLLVGCGLLLAMWLTWEDEFYRSVIPHWLWEFRVPWIPQVGIEFSLGADGLSLLLIALTYFIGLIAVMSSWEGITQRVGFFHLNLMALLSALVGVFVARDLILFYFFWELMLVPLYLLIGIWGHENRIYATIKFFLFTQAASLMMLLAILVLYFAHVDSGGDRTFDFEELVNTPLSPATAFWLMLGFFVAFAVKLPAVPLHTWLPDAHTEAPTAGSICLASLVLKAGAFGFIRFLLPLFPQACIDLAPVAMTLGVVGILYGAITAFAQKDLKRLVAYTSVSHMGFVLLGVFAMNDLAMAGAVVVMLAHGLSTGALFMLVGALGDRLHTRDLSRLGGLWAVAPRMGGVMTFFALASLGLPGLANFVGEFLVLLGAFQAGHTVLASIAALGMVVSVIYSLWMLQKAFHGPNTEGWKMSDLGIREMAMSAALIAATVWIGLYPQPVLDLWRAAAVTCGCPKMTALTPGPGPSEAGADTECSRHP